MKQEVKILPKMKLMFMWKDCCHSLPFTVAGGSSEVDCVHSHWCEELANLPAPVPL